MAGFGTGAGKGPLPRHIDLEKKDATLERVYGKRETWWEKRDRLKAEEEALKKDK